MAMGASTPAEEVVTMRLGDPTVITINCADKIGLSCDFARIILEAGLHVARADLSTDGKWCYQVFWVVPRPGPRPHIRWHQLKRNLVAACPPNPQHIFFLTYIEPKPANIFSVQICSKNGDSLLHEVVNLFGELEITVHRLKLLTAPDGRVVGIFYVTEKREMLHTKKRQNEITDRLKLILGGESDMEVKIQAIPSDIHVLECAPAVSLLPPELVNIFNINSSKAQTDLGDQHQKDAFHQNISINFDNSLSPGHTLVQIACKDRMGLLYDVLRTFKDYNFQVSYGRLSKNSQGESELDLFIVQADGRKIIDPDKQSSICLRLRHEILYPVKVFVADRGPETELIVATRIELGGRGRPRVLDNVTLVLKTLGISIFSADFGRYVVNDLHWELYRFLLTENLTLTNQLKRREITENVRKILIG